MFTHRARIYLHHTDAAGRLFFANQFYLIYEAKEHFLLSLGFDMDLLLNDEVATFPLVHAESDYKLQLKTGDMIDISVGVEKIGETSITFVYTIMKEGVLAGTAKTVSVAVDKASGKKMPIPEQWRQRFSKSLK